MQYRTVLLMPINNLHPMQIQLPPNPLRLHKHLHNILWQQHAIQPNRQEMLTHLQQHQHKYQYYRQYYRHGCC